ncbi:hypothetical protein CY34DRAFT_111177, partial [Suillus luteus UH-Slu-Lm8-n1]
SHGGTSDLDESELSLILHDGILILDATFSFGGCTYYKHVFEKKRSFTRVQRILPVAASHQPCGIESPGSIRPQTLAVLFTRYLGLKNSTQAGVREFRLQRFKYTGLMSIFYSECAIVLHVDKLKSPFVLNASSRRKAAQAGQGFTFIEVDYEVAFRNKASLPATPAPIESAAPYATIPTLISLVTIPFANTISFIAALFTFPISPVTTRFAIPMSPITTLPINTTSRITAPTTILLTTLRPPGLDFKLNLNLKTLRLMNGPRMMGTWWTFGLLMSSLTSPSSPHVANSEFPVSNEGSTSSTCAIATAMENAARKRESQTYMMSLDGIDMEDDEQDVLFAKYSVDSVYLSYMAARNRVRQYTQLLALLKCEEDAWLQRVEKAKYV